MVVKASTKKRLMDMGMPVSIAHWLADDRRFYRERRLSGAVQDNTPILLYLISNGMNCLMKH